KGEGFGKGGGSGLILGLGCGGKFFQGDRELFVLIQHLAVVGPELVGHFNSSMRLLGRRLFALGNGLEQSQRRERVGILFDKVITKNSFHLLRRLGRFSTGGYGVCKLVMQVLVLSLHRRWNGEARLAMCRGCGVIVLVILRDGAPSEQCERACSN